jgi:PAS domain S-box-containing protein
MSREHTTILLIEDNPGDARLIREMLPEGGGVVRSLEWVESLEAGRRRIAQGGIDLVLLDLGLPESVGLETLRRLRDKAAHLPAVVVMSSLADEAIAVQAVMEGAQDYLVKGQVDGRLLIRSIRYAIERNETAGALRRAHDELENQVLERTATLAHANESLEREIAERKRAEDTLRRLNRELRAISNCNQVLVRAEDEQLLLNDVCRIVCDEAGYRMAWVGYAENDEAKTVRAVAWAGVEDGYLAKANITWADTERGRGPAGTAIRTGETACAQDFDNSPQFAPWRESALQRGYQSAIALPLKDEGGRVFGIFLIYAAEINAFTPDEIRLLEELASDLAFGITILRTRADRKKAEEALDYERDLWRALLDNSPDKIYFKDRQSRFVKASKAMVVQFGVESPEALAGRTDFDFFTDAHARPAFEDEQKIIRTGQPMIDLEEREVWKDGRVTWVTSTKLPWLDDQGKIIGIMGISRDITARKRAEESHARLATAVEQSAETIVITDTAAKILYVNPAFEKTTGYTRAEALGQNSRILKSGKQDAGFYRQMWEALRRGEVWQGHFINQRKDGKLYEEEATISPVRDAAGAVVNYVAVKRDVTHEKQIEAQFRQAQKMDAIGTLAGGVAHDFNNMLAVIQMLASLLKSGGNLSPEQVKFADEIEATVERAATLTRQLLLFSRHEAAQPRELDLNESIANTTKMLRRILRESIGLEIRLAAPPMFVHADAGMMDQVLLNLAVNARDAMPNGGRIVIETAGVEFDEFTAAQAVPARPGSFVCLSVTDTGCGIPPEILPRIFEPFFTTKGVGKGTGLGLATVFGIVQQHQGWINVDSVVGQGTTFKVYLPRLADMTGRKIAVKMQAAPPTGKETILLVEDEPSLLNVFRQTLARLGYHVLAASTGVKALEIWQAHRAEIHLLLTDLTLPDSLSGKHLAQRLLQENPQLKVICMSGYSAEAADKNFPLHEGVNFLTKPFEPHKLAQIIRERLDKPA